MAFTPEAAINRILNYRPENSNVGQRQVVGTVGGGELVHDFYAFPLRAIHLAGEPIISGQGTKQHVLALEEVVNGQKRARVLAYRTDIESLGVELIKQVAELI